jgi:hypothetical protein
MATPGGRAATAPWSMERLVTGSPAGREPPGRRPPFGSAAGPLARLPATSPLSVTLWLAVGFAIVLLAYLILENALLLVALVALAVAGVDRLVRMHPEARFHGAGATVLYLFVPALYALGAGLLLAGWAGGLWNLPAALLGGALFGVIAFTEYHTVDSDAEAYETARTTLLLVIYVVAVVNFIAAFTADVNLAVSVIFVAATAFLLTVDMVRELESETAALLMQAGAVALVMAEARIAVYFTPLADEFAGLFLLLAYYVMTTLVQSQMSGRLERRTLPGLAIVVVIGLIFIVGGNIITR